MDNTVINGSKDKFETLLGCRFQPNLKWSENISSLRSKLSSRIVGLDSIRRALPGHTLNTIATGWFNSVLVYCLPLFGGCAKGDLQDLQIIQNKLARLITYSPLDTNRRKLYEKLQWMTVNQLISYHTILAVYRIRANEEPEDLITYFKLENRNQNIIIPQSNMELYRKSFIYRSIRSWNLVPKSIRNIPTLMTFKRHLKNWIFKEVEMFQ